MYRTVDAAFWSDPKIKRLCPKGKLLALYLITNPLSHVGGIYYLPSAIIRDETGLKQTEIDTLFHTLSGAGFAKNDPKTEVVWVVKMFLYQGRGEKNERSVANQLDTLHNSFLVNEFLEFYTTVKRFVKDRVSNRVSGAGSITHSDQEQDQDKETTPFNSPSFSEAQKKGRFTKPTLTEVAAYCRERKNTISPQKFLDHYEAKGWVVGKSPMKDWKACVRTWEGNQGQRGQDGDALDLDAVLDSMEPRK